MNKLTLNCPIRGELKTGKKSKDGLTSTEEYFRVEAIKHLIKEGYPASNFKIEPIVKKFGNSGRNSFRSDFAVLDVPADSPFSRKYKNRQSVPSASLSAAETCAGNQSSL